MQALRGRRAEGRGPCRHSERRAPSAMQALRGRGCGVKGCCDCRGKWLHSHSMRLYCVLHHATCFNGMHHFRAIAFRGVFCRAGAATSASPAVLRHLILQVAASHDNPSRAVRPRNSKLKRPHPSSPSGRHVPPNQMFLCTSTQAPESP